MFNKIVILNYWWLFLVLFKIYTLSFSVFIYYEVNDWYINQVFISVKNSHIGGVLPLKYCFLKETNWSIRDKKCLVMT